MLTSLVRWILTLGLALFASMYAMETVRSAGVAIVTAPPVAQQEAKKKQPKPANAIARASRMDKVAEALKSEDPRSE